MFVVVQLRSRSFFGARSRSHTVARTMQPRRQHGTAELRKAPRKASETSNRFADEALRLENQKLREVNGDLELRLAARTTQLAATNLIKDDLLARERKARE